MRGQGAEEILYGRHQRYAKSRYVAETKQYHNDIVVLQIFEEQKLIAEHNDLQDWLDEQTNFDSYEDCCTLLRDLYCLGMTARFGNFYRITDREEFQRQFSIIQQFG